MTITTSVADTAAMASDDTTSRRPRRAKAAPAGVDAALVDQLVAQARERGLQLSGEGGLLQQLTKIVLESALDGEITDHLGYDRHDPAGAKQRQFPQRCAGQDCVDRCRSGRGRRTPRPRRQLRAGHRA